MNRMPTREDCPTCWAKRDKEHNRLPIGFWHPTDCLMAVLRTAHLMERDRLKRTRGHAR